MSLGMTSNEATMLRILDYEQNPSCAWQRYDITGNDTHAEIHCTTNDDDDDGYPDGEIQEWIEEGYKGIAQALRVKGVSRFGVSGVAVIVTVNGIVQMPA